MKLMEIREGFNKNIENGFGGPVKETGIFSKIRWSEALRKFPIYIYIYFIFLLNYPRSLCAWTTFFPRSQTAWFEVECYDKNPEQTFLDLLIRYQQ